ncbi:hypothetical protein R7D64_14115 [Vibrio sp. Vb2535]|uniref:hypothetical protein n=1 Tax=Vibrio TaxID=662 RepID=UPI00215C8412|nr:MULTISPECIES: hypothetical protein [Vibrio]MCR9885151.1 hypothetical protein [Vibrio alginolyticus]MDW1754055.1 hypothetical protein [Vibrio sp. Vb2535]
MTTTDYSANTDERQFSLSHLFLPFSEGEPMAGETQRKNNHNKRRYKKHPRFRRQKARAIPEATRIASCRLSNYPSRSFMLKSLGISRKDVRTRMSQLLETLLDDLDWSTLRIGVAKKEHLDPITYEDFIDRHKKLHNETIPRSTWYRYIKKLTDAGYLNSTTAKISTSEGKVFNKPAYKWFTQKFMSELGFKTDWLAKQKEHALKSLKAKGLSNQWRVFEGRSARIACSMAISLQVAQDYRYTEGDPYILNS